MFLDAMEPRILPNLKAQVDVFGGISRREQGKPILAKEVVSNEVWDQKAITTHLLGRRAGKDLTLTARSGQHFAGARRLCDHRGGKKNRGGGTSCL